VKKIQKPPGDMIGWHLVLTVAHLNLQFESVGKNKNAHDAAFIATLVEPQNPICLASRPSSTSLPSAVLHALSPARAVLARDVFALVSVTADVVRQAEGAFYNSRSRDVLDEAQMSSCP
jgi:hypothetical protein